MIRVILSGCRGKMGRVISDMLAGSDSMVTACGIDPAPGPDLPYPVYASPFDYHGEADVIIDFSHPSALPAILGFALERRLPIVVATTGLSPDDTAAIHAAARDIPVFFSANMSLGINLLIGLVKKAAHILGGFDIEIIEKHHNQKIDAPSGTALMIADAVSSQITPRPRYVFDRHSALKKRDAGDIGIHAVRGGTIVGEHEVLFCGKDEVVSIKHEASSKEVFATGSVRAAAWLVGLPPGLYDMNSLIENCGEDV